MNPPAFRWVHPNDLSSMFDAGRVSAFREILRRIEDLKRGGRTEESMLTDLKYAIQKTIGEDL